MKLKQLLLKISKTIDQRIESDIAAIVLLYLTIHQQQ
jgi:hypothetical protein